jgi:hypothetical protein
LAIAPSGSIIRVGERLAGLFRDDLRQAIYPHLQGRAGACDEKTVFLAGRNAVQRPDLFNPFRTATLEQPVGIVVIFVAKDDW